MTTATEAPETEAPPVDGAGLGSLFLVTALALSIPLAVLFLSEGVIRPTVPLAALVALLWLGAGAHWLVTTRSRGRDRLLHPVPLAVVAVLGLAFISRAAEAPFKLSEGALGSYAKAALSDSDAGQPNKQRCFTDDLKRFGLVLASVSCGPSGQVVFKTSVRPLLPTERPDYSVGRGNMVGGFVYVSEPETTEPGVFGFPCSYDQLTDNFYRYSCVMFQPVD